MIESEQLAETNCSFFMERSRAGDFAFFLWLHAFQISGEYQLWASGKGQACHWRCLKESVSYNIKEKNLHIIFQEELSLEDALHELKSSYGCEKLTIQSGGTVNGLFLREKLFDYIDVVVAPVLIGGKETASLIDGSSITSENELSGLSVLKLIDCTILNVSYIRVRYQVISWIKEIKMPDAKTQCKPR